MALIALTVSMVSVDAKPARRQTQIHANFCQALPIARPAHPRENTYDISFVQAASVVNWPTSHASQIFSKRNPNPAKPAQASPKAIQEKGLVFLGFPLPNRAFSM